MTHVISFAGPGLGDLGFPVVHRQERGPIEDAVRRSVVSVLIIDAREPDAGFRGLELLRALYDDPRRAGSRPGLHPQRVLALIADNDVETAFAFGRFGIAGVVEDHARSGLAARVRQVAASEPDAPPHLGPQRPLLLASTSPGEPSIVTIGYRHAPETRAGFERYCASLREHAEHSSVFEDVATLLELLEREGLTARTLLATKAGVAHAGQFIGSLEFYRQLRRTRYRHIPDPPDAALSMEAFISIDEVLHEVLHLLFLANRLRAGVVATHPYLAEELSVGWWQGIVHNHVFPDWIADRRILEINHDFVYCEPKQVTWEFWKIGNVFDQYAHYPWVGWVIDQLPERRSYIGERPDVLELFSSFEHEPAARFLGPRVDELRIQSLEFDGYPETPAGWQTAQ